MDYMIFLRTKASAGCNYLKLKPKWRAKIFITACGYVTANKVEVTIQIQYYQGRDWFWLWSQQLLLDSQTHHLLSEYSSLL